MRLILGLKIRQTRLEKKISLKELSEATGISISYLNEIEKGKKNPKPLKIAGIAERLDISYDWLVSLKLDDNLAPFQEILNENTLSNLPLDFYGIDNSKLLELFTSEPSKIAAFIKVIEEISSNYEISQNTFLRYALHSYIELLGPLNQELELKAQDFIKHNKLPVFPDENILKDLLTVKYSIPVNRSRFDENTFQNEIEAIFYKGRVRKLITNELLRKSQRKLVYSKSLASIELNVDQRAVVMPVFQSNRFTNLLDEYRIGYLAGAILIHKEQIRILLTDLMDSVQWKPWLIEEFCKNHDILPETLAKRCFSLLKDLMKIDHYYYHKMEFDSVKNEFCLIENFNSSLDVQAPSEKVKEHYCRRWSAVKHSLEISAESKRRDTRDDIMVNSQILIFNDSNNEFLEISLCRISNLNSNKAFTHTIGILLDEKQRKRLRFLADPKIKILHSANSCERCSELTCKERVAQPVIYNQKRESEAKKQALDEMIENYRK